MTTPFKLLRDKFVSADGLTHVEAALQQVSFCATVDAACGRWFSQTAIDYVPDENRVTSVGCLAEQEA